MKEITQLAIEHACLVQKHYCNEEVVIAGFNPIGKSIRYTPLHVGTLLGGFGVSVKCAQSFALSNQSSDEMALLHLGWLGVDEGVIERVRSLVGGLVRHVNEVKTHCVLSIDIEPTEGVWKLAIVVGSSSGSERIGTEVAPVGSLPRRGRVLVLDSTVVNPYVFCASVIECASSGGSVLVKTKGVMPLAGVFSVNHGLERFVYESFLQGARAAGHLSGSVAYDCFGADYSAASIVAPAIASRKHTHFDYSATERCVMSAVGATERALVQVDSGRVKFLIKPANAHSVKTLIAEALGEPWECFEMGSINNYSITIDSLERAQSFDSLVMDFSVTALYEKLCTGEGRVMGSFTLFMVNYFPYRGHMERQEKVYNCKAIVLETGEVLSKVVSTCALISDKVLTLTKFEPNSLFGGALIQAQIIDALESAESFDSIVLKSFDSKPYNLSKELLVFLSSVILRKKELEQGVDYDWSSLLSCGSSNAYLIEVDTAGKCMVSVKAI